MDFEKRNNIYKTIMMIIIAVLITFIVTALGVSRYYEKTEAGLEKIIENNDSKSALDTKIQGIRTYLEKKYLGEFPDDEKLEEAAVKGYVEGLGDEYTEYLTKDEYEQLMTNVVGSYVGIGVYLTQDRNGDTVILMPLEDSPAEAIGLKTGDIIVKVDGEECNGVDLTIVANKVKGEEGTKVNLEVLREGKTLTFEIERKIVKLNKIKAKVLENNIGYIQILSFDENCSTEFQEKLNELLKQNIKSLIIDIRNNGGGIVKEATDIADLFIPKDKTIMIELGKDSEEKIVKSEKDEIINSNIKVIVLGNENSASAAEILLGALKENEVATIVGTTSFGKGVMQEIVPVSNGGALKITIQEFRTPNGNIINKKGIEPNIEVDDDLNTEEDEQLNKAIQECKK